MSLAQIIIGLAVGYAIFLLFFGLAVAAGRDPIQVRVDSVAARRRTLEQIEMGRPFHERVLQPLIRNAAKLLIRLVPRLDLQAIQRKLSMAGNPNQWTAIDFLGVRCVTGLLGLALPLILILLGGSLSSNMLLLTVVSGVLGFYIPVLWLGGKIRARQKEIRRNLPDTLDLLTLGVEAGLSFEHAMAKVAQSNDDELARAFARVLAEVQLGKIRAVALRDMADQAAVPELTHFVTALIQADQLGVSIVKVLRIQSDEMRIKRRQRAEEEAHRAPVKMSIVLVLFLLPALFLILLGPSVQRICHMFSPDNPFCSI
jgi:tight adherence protein C